MKGQKPHRRQNLLTGEWVLVSPHRMGRPWQGETGDSTPPSGFAHDPACYLCAGNARVGGVINPTYDGVWVFDNDFPALLAPDGEAGQTSDPVLVTEPETGVCRVICYTPDHSKTMASMTRDEIASVVHVWTAQWQELSARPDLASVTIFENRGAMMGASNPHPHGQIWATSSIPNELATEVGRQAAWFDKNGTALLMDYLERELTDGSRILCSSAHFVALVPFWAAWPFETLVLPRRAVAALDELRAEEQSDLADVLRRLTASYDRVFNAPFPYTMGLHQRPTQSPAPGFVFHMHFYPPLLRSATVRKFMVGFEMLAMAQRDLTPEAAAERLRTVWVD
ncbi:UDP-glucose--hexose-1-phosphate uridylyltransferase [Aquidulcibacter paucihalophilus]|uniref:UDP-glucose--hexose-1-phosphate uridylyltransferase n=1 Tax=Aquidulcibacter paucihalophilus TaxID=1978549 RepID=UPI000A191A12|nr:UDP-glucose--hexose-1-phosphate uridylyltransferase [Aquidulcibacter paucihalophilus]